MKRIVLACALALAACGNTPAPATHSTIDVQVVGPAGGTIVGQGDATGAQVVIPFGALPQDTPVALGEDPDPPPDPPGTVAVSISLLCSPEGLQFQKPATLFLPYRGLSDVALYTARAVPGAEWEYYDAGAADISANVFRAPISHFSRWRAFRAVVDGGLPDGG